VKTLAKLDPNRIRTDGGTQPRAATDQATVTEYAADMTEGAKFPPVVVFTYKGEYWLADGFHRVLAARVIGSREIEADVRVGTQRDAMLFACGANAAHGMRRTAADKRRSVFRLLGDSEWSKWSDVKIAQQCNVSHDLVGDCRRSLSPSEGEPPSERTYTTKHGTESTMDTGRIGRRPEPAAEAELKAERESYNQAAETAGTDHVAEVLIAEIDTMLDALKSDSFRHSVINALVKHLREKSIDLNRKAGAA
jgi:hypothetical protein